jgi:hypothetical protein
MGRGQDARKIGDRLALAAEQLAADLVRENLPTPATLSRLLAKSDTLIGIFDGLDQHDHIAPR